MTGRFISVLLAGTLVLTGACCAVQVDGYCNLEGQSNHSGTRVLFEADSPTAETDSAFTDATGYYQADLANGVYDIFFFHEGYSSHSIPNQMISSPTTLPVTTLLGIPEGIHLSDILFGTLEDTTYLLHGYCYVPEDSTLTITPGATIYLDHDGRIDALGALYAIGTDVDSIKFLPIPGVSHWEFIELNRNNSRLEYCLITRGGDCGSGLVFCDGYNSNHTISHCVISNGSTRGIYLNTEANATITYCTITGNSSNGINCSNADPVIDHCVISGNNVPGSGRGGGIYNYFALPIITNCTICGNDGDGIFYNCSNSASRVVNTIVSHNTGGYGIGFSQATQVSISFCDFFGNAYGDFDGSIPQYLGEIVTVNANGDPCDVFLNIFEDPHFVNFAGDDFHLLSGSACIDAGDPNSPLDPDSTITDLGAFYFNHPSPCIGVSSELLDFGSVLIGNDSLISLFIYNFGDTALVLYSVETTSPCFSINYNPVDSLIQPGDSLEIRMIFSPQDTISYNEFLIIENNDELVEVSLQGFGEPSSSVIVGSFTNVPETYMFLKPHPNPFNPTTTLEYAVPTATQVNLVVYDVMGRKVATLVDDWCNVGTHKAVFDGSRLASGIYFARMQMGDYHQVQKMVLLK